MQSGKVDGLDVVDPLRKAFALEPDEHVGEGADVAGKRVQFRAVGEHGREHKAVQWRIEKGAT